MMCSEPEVLAEVNLTNLFVADDLRGGPLASTSPALMMKARSQMPGFADVVVGDQHADTLCLSGSG